MALGPEALPVTSDVDFSNAMFKQCGAYDKKTETISHIHKMLVEMCNPGTHGRYMYVYDKLNKTHGVQICEIHVVASSKYQPLKQYH